MNVLELKGSLFDAIGQIKEESTLQRILAFIHKNSKEENTDWWFSLPAEVQKEIEDAYEESEDENLLISNNEAMQKLEKWL